MRKALERFRTLAPDDTSQYAEEFWEPDGDYYPAKGFPDARPCHGHAELSRYLADYLRAWDRFEFAINRLIAAGDDHVLSHVTVRAEGRKSGLRLNGDLYQCVWLRNGRVLRQEDHLTLQGAIRGLGLEGETLRSAGLSE
jgi:ketosteroid isomerase-like protein